MTRNRGGRATLIIERINDAEDHLRTAFSALRLEYMMALIRKHRLRAEIDYGTLEETTVFITLSPKEMVTLLEEAYYAGLGNFFVELGGDVDEALFDHVRQFEVVCIERI